MFDLFEKISGALIVLSTMFSFFVGLPVLVIRLMRASRDPDDLELKADLKSVALVAGSLLSGHVFISGNSRKISRRHLPLFDRLRLFDSQQPGTVRVSFTVYRGFLAFVEQTTFHVYGPAEDCEEFLRRGVSYSISNGLLAAGGLMIPLVLYPTYWSQRRKVRWQVHAMTPKERKIWPPLARFQDEVEKEERELPDPDDVFENDTPEVPSPGVLPWKSIILGLIALGMIPALAMQYWVSVVNKDSGTFGAFIFMAGLTAIVSGGLAVSFAREP